jgi:hypothetical protein
MLPPRGLGYAEGAAHGQLRHVMITSLLAQCVNGAVLPLAGRLIAIDEPLPLLREVDKAASDALAIHSIAGNRATRFFAAAMQTSRVPARTTELTQKNRTAGSARRRRGLGLALLIICRARLKPRQSDRTGRRRGLSRRPVFLTQSPSATPPTPSPYLLRSCADAILLLHAGRHPFLDAFRGVSKAFGPRAHGNCKLVPRAADDLDFEEQVPLPQFEGHYDGTCRRHGGHMLDTEPDGKCQRHLIRAR